MKETMDGLVDRGPEWLQMQCPEIPDLCFEQMMCCQMHARYRIYALRKRIERHQP